MFFPSTIPGSGAMNKSILLLGVSVFAILSPAARADGNHSKFKAPDLASILPLLDASSPEALEGVLRGVALKHLPQPLFEASPGWGETRMVVNQIKWRKKGILLRPEVYKTPRNHGTWRKVRVEAIHPENTLILDLRHVQFPQPGTLVFGVYLAFDTRANYVQENWNSGVRVYAGSVRARFRTIVHMKCQVDAEFVSGKSILPDAVLQFRIIEAGLSYDNLDFEHVPGLGGTAADLIGKAAHRSLNDWHPNLEHELLARASQSILRAGQTREVRISLSKVLNKALGVK
jgi:hypothetical protein